MIKNVRNRLARRILDGLPREVVAGVYPLYSLAVDRSFVRARHSQGVWFIRRRSTWFARQDLPLRPDRALDTSDHPAFAFSEPKPGDTVLQIGAATGEELERLVETVEQDGLIVAVEANPFTFAVLTEVIRRNGWSNVVPLAAAYLPGSRWTTIETGENLLANAIGTSHGVVVGTVDGPAISELLEARGGPDRVIINVEGGERSIVPELLASMGPAAVVVSCHDFRADRGDGEEFRTAATVEAAMRSAGYRVRRVDSGTDWHRSWMEGQR